MVVPEPDSNKKQQTLSLIAQKDKIEKQIAELGNILQNVSRVQNANVSEEKFQILLE